MTLDDLMLRTGRLYISWLLASDEAAAAEKKAASYLQAINEIGRERDALEQEVVRLRAEVGRLTALVPKRHREG